ncbi:hypothetical protein LNKW23_03270 [Paralimibaculum aggregatum]|uniref:Uncharacterized protein n=1 Tax=Paralimibaculum aggregatum TaxID=3036245 RepID=A0ABQ6LLE8_9RHOB|nr:hypothetical protein [Limibaculum sp. NKW23]GMG81115.1 hypothetical protein LNKW23_03270 [Limibaculum sp. NKW23]
MSATATADPKEFLDTPVVRRYLGEIVNATEAALTLAGRNLQSGALKACTAATLATYRGDVAACEASYGDFNDAWNRVISGRARDLDDFEGAYQTHLIALEIVEEMNVPFSAVVDAALGVKLTLFFTLVGQVSGHARTFLAIRQKLDQTRRDLEKLKRILKGKAAKTALGAAIAGATLAAGPIGVAATLGIAVSATAAGMVIDKVVGAGGSMTRYQAAHKTSETMLSCYDQLDRVKVRGLGPMLSFVAISLDAAETAQAAALKAAIDKRVKALEKDFKRALKDFERQSRELEAAARAARTAHDRAVRAANGFASRKAERERLLRELP